MKVEIPDDLIAEIGRGYFDRELQHVEIITSIHNGRFCLYLSHRGASDPELRIDLEVLVRSLAKGNRLAADIDELEDMTASFKRIVKFLERYLERYLESAPERTNESSHQLPG